MATSPFEKMRSAFDPAWAGLRSAGGAKPRQRGSPWGDGLTFASDEAARDALAECFASGWKIMEALTADDPDDFPFALTLFNQGIDEALRDVCRSGHWMGAMAGLESHAKATGAAWDWHPGLGRLAELACEDPLYGRADPSELPERLEALARSQWWGFEPSKEAKQANMMDGKSARSWLGAIANMCRLAALRPERAPSCARVVALWRDRCSDNVCGDEDLGRRMAEELGRMKIADGALPGLIWAELPFGVRLGVSLGVHAESKLGQWSMSQLLNDVAADGSDLALPMKQELCAAFWCSLERPRVDALEAAFPGAADAWLSDGMQRWFGNGDAGMKWHEAENAWKDKRSAWARKSLALAGHKASGEEGFSNKFFGKDEAYLQALSDLRSMMQAEQIRESLPKAKPATAKKRSSL